MSRPLLCFLVLLFTSSNAVAQISIATTIRPLQLIAAAIVGDAGTATAIVDQQDSPHHYIVSPADRINLDRADLLIWVGEEFEIFLSDFFSKREQSGSVIEVLTIPGLVIHELASGQTDPHVWLDSNNALTVARAIAKELEIIQPGDAAEFQSNLARFGERLHELDDKISELFTDASKADYVVYHDAYQYFEKQYGLGHQLALLENPEVEPGMRQILTSRAQLKSISPACVLLEQDSNQALVTTMLGDLRPRLLTVDLLGYKLVTDDYSYPKLISSVANQFNDCLYNDSKN